MWVIGIVFTALCLTGVCAIGIMRVIGIFIMTLVLPVITFNKYSAGCP